MLCENCGQRPATIHQTIISDGNKTETHFCEVCAREKGVPDMLAQGNFSFPNLSIHQLLSSFLGQDPFGGTAVAPKAQAEPRCTRCGMAYSEFAETGRLGCAQCYDDLDLHLAPLIKRIHGTLQHAGKAPKRTGGVLRKRRDLAGLRQELTLLVGQEKYEEAARLRDRIRELEAEIQAGGGGVVVE